ncbi:hypothetical protein BGX38DRAFT_1146323 [Terfezia claveryi]|nr:hypothetical protein BGX38DRAFT_1146323 [Terfezia claveryi]
MRWIQPAPGWVSFLILYISAVLPGVTAAHDYVIGTRSLKPCMANSGITATFIDVSFHTNTSTLHFDINAYSTISGKVQVLMTVYAYGFKAFTQEFDPCQIPDWTQLCPMSPQPIQVNSNQDLGSDLVSQIPAIAYQVPDLDAYVRIQIVSADAQKKLLACVDAHLSNGITVEKGPVSWITAFLGGGALLWVVFVISCSNPTLPYYHLTTAKFAAYSLAFYTLLQHQALIGMTSVPLPPIVSAWTQNFVWAVGIVEMNFMQRFFNWYIRSTGGHRSSLFNQISTTSILVMKRNLGGVRRRGLEFTSGIGRNALRRRAADVESTSQDVSSYQPLMVKGIERVAFKAGIEQTNLFLTSYSMYIIFAFVVVVFFLAFRGLVEWMVKKQKMGMQNRLPVFREHWKSMLKKVALCLLVMGYPALISLSLWELTMRDSPAVIVLAVVIFLAMTGLMAATVFRLYMLLRRTGVMPFSLKGPLARFSTKSADMEKPASTSWRDSVPLSESKATASRDLKQFAILTVPYRRSGAYWVLPLMLFVFTKSALVGLSQQHLYDAPSEDQSSIGTTKGIAQAIGFLIIDLLWFIGVAWVRPWMDKPTNTLGIAGAVMGLLNGIFLLIFTEAVPGQTKPAKPIVGVLFVLFNIIMSLIFLIVTIVSAIYAIIDWKNCHPAPPGAKIEGVTTVASISAEDYGNDNMTSTPDPFLPPTHGNDTLPALPNSRSFSHVLSEDGRASASTFDSRDILAMQPTEPNISTISFNGNGRGTGIIVTSPKMTDNVPGYPLQNINTNHSTQSPLGVVMISSGKSDDGRSTYAESARSARSRDGAPPSTSNQHLPSHLSFSRQDSHLSQRSMNSIHSQKSFSRPNPVYEGLEQGRSGYPSQACINRENPVSKLE